MQKAHKRAKCDCVGSDHASKEGNSDEVVQVHFPEIVVPLFDEKHFVGVLEKVPKLDQRVQQQAWNLLFMGKVRKEVLNVSASAHPGWQAISLVEKPVRPHRGDEVKKKFKDEFA